MAKLPKHCTTVGGVTAYCREVWWRSDCVSDYCPRINENKRVPDLPMSSFAYSYVAYTVCVGSRGWVKG
jgi:hypothetical protein